MNLLDVFSEVDRWRVLAFTTHNDRGRTPYSNPAISLFRIWFPSLGSSRVRRAWTYFWFPFKTLFQLLWFRPNVVLYIEPHSAPAVFFYSLLNRRCRLFIHYHEYREVQHYQEPGMRFVSWCHELEKRHLYRRAEWISHTNSDRVRMFLEDLPTVDATRMQTISNCPPKGWFGQCSVNWPEIRTEPLRLVYAGAVSRKDTWIEELVNWVLSGDNCVSLDIYSINADEDTNRYLTSLKSEKVVFNQNGVDYDQLPNLLRQYHVGLILYKGVTRNYIYNAPNKLFEYLACGLDVWYPRQMLSVREYMRSDAIPRVLELDFEAMHDWDFESVRSRKDIPVKPFQTDCGIELQQLQIAIDPSLQKNSAEA